MERRKTKRIKANAAIAFHSKGSERQALTFDLSREGCKLQTSTDFLKPGAAIELSFGKRSVLGVIVWVEGRNAGVKFDEPLDSSAIGAILHNVIGMGLKSLLPSQRLMASPRTAFWRRSPRPFLQCQVGLDADSNGVVRYDSRLNATGRFVALIALAMYAALVSASFLVA